MSPQKVSALLAALLLSLLSSAVAFAQKNTPSGTVPTFERDIRPLLASQCVGCHSRATVGNPALSGGLALDTYEALMQGVRPIGRERRPVVLSRRPAESALVRRLETKDTARRMPKGGAPLPADKVTLIKRWIALGAVKGTADKAAARPPSAIPALARGPVLDVLFPIALPPPPDLVTPKTPQDARLALALPVGPLAPVTALAYSPDGKTLAVGTYQAVVLWDMEAGRVARTLGGLSGTVHAVAWSADGGLLAVAGGAPGALGEIRLYEAKAEFKFLRLLTGHTDVVYSLAFSPNSQTLAGASHDKTVRTWNVADGKPLLTFLGHSDVVYQVRFMPDGKSLISCGQDKAVRQFDAGSGQSIRNFEGHDGAVTALAVRPDGQFIVSSGAEPRLRWWNPADGATVRFSDGHGAQVNDIAFSADGRWLAAASADRTVQIWNGSDGGGPQQTFGDAPDWNYRVAVSPDGRFVAGGGADGLVRLWEIEPGQFRAALLAVPARTGAGAEWAVLTPAGYFATSSGWAKQMRLALAGAPVQKRAAALLAALQQAESVKKSLHGEAVEPPQLPAPPPQEPRDAKP